MLLALFLRASSDVIGHVGPVPQAIHLRPFDQQQLFIGTPVSREDRERVGRDDAVRVCRAMRARRLACQEALCVAQAPR